MADDWRTPDIEALFDAILGLETPEEAERFFRDLCTLNELRDMAQRWAVVRLLDSGMHYAEISRETGASTATITRIASWLNHGEGGYRAMLDKLGAARGPARPYPPAPSDEGAPPARGPQQGPAGRADARAPPRRRASSSRSTTGASSPRVQNYDLDILFVRTNDVIEFVGDGVADLGITGVDLLTRDRRRAAARPLARLRPLPPRRRRPQRHALPDRRGPRRAARRDRPPEHRPALLRRAAASPSTSSRSRARSRSRRGSASPRRSSTSSRPARRS